MSGSFQNRYVLCRECSRVSSYSDERHNGSELCDCGGNFCGCSYCNSSAHKIVKSGWPLAKPSIPLDA